MRCSRRINLLRHVIGSAKVAHGSLQLGELAQIGIARHSRIVIRSVIVAIRVPKDGRSARSLSCMSCMLVCTLTGIQQVSQAHAAVVFAIRMAEAAVGPRVGGALCGGLTQCRCFVQFADVAQVSRATDHAASRSGRGAVGTMRCGGGDQVSWIGLAHLCV